MKKLLLVLVCLSAFPQFASARNIWRECGIGGMIFTKTGWAAITSNIIWDLGTTATTSQVSSDDLCEGSAASLTAKYVNESYAILEEEIAIGEGEHLTAMLDIMGCAQHENMIQNLRQNLSQKMVQPSYRAQSHNQKAESFYNNTVILAQTNKCSLI